jgi:hypothetical protein
MKFEFLVKSRVDQVKAAMTYSMKSENKLDGASNFRAWKTRIDLILAKNKVLDISEIGKIVKPEFEEGKEKGVGTQWSSQDVGCICRKLEHKKGVSDI